MGGGGWGQVAANSLSFVPADELLIGLLSPRRVGTANRQGPGAEAAPAYQCPV